MIEKKVHIVLFHYPNNFIIHNTSRLFLDRDNLLKKKKFKRNVTLLRNDPSYTY